MNVAYDQYYSVWEWSKGVVFLGTPHRGSTVADLGTILGNIGNAVWSATGSHRWKVAISTSLLHALKSNSNELNDINEVFIQRASALSIETFFETYLTQPVGTLVRTDPSLPNIPPPSPHSPSASELLYYYQIGNTLKICG